MKPYFNRLSLPSPAQSTNTYHRPKLMRDKKLEIREFGLAGCSFAFCMLSAKVAERL